MYHKAALLEQTFSTCTAQWLTCKWICRWPECMEIHQSLREEEKSTIGSMDRCMLNIKDWMDETRLKMNISKTEFIYFGFNKQISKCACDMLRHCWWLNTKNRSHQIPWCMHGTLDLHTRITSWKMSKCHAELHMASPGHLTLHPTYAKVCAFFT